MYYFFKICIITPFYLLNMLPPLISKYYFEISGYPLEMHLLSKEYIINSQHIYCSNFNTRAAGAI